MLSHFERGLLRHTIRVAKILGVRKALINRLRRRLFYLEFHEDIDFFFARIDEVPNAKQRQALKGTLTNMIAMFEQIEDAKVIPNVE